MKKISSVSAILIVKNAAGIISACLKSLMNFDEVILLLDNSTTDNTYELASAFPNVKIHSQEFLGFGKTKKKAVSMAKNDWVFSIDADEIVSPELMEELSSLSLVNPEIVYTVHRKNHYQGVYINACGWNNDYIPRLFNRSHTNFNDAKIHEHIVLHSNSKEAILKNSLLHYPYHNVKGLIEKLNHYSELYAEENFRRKTSSTRKSILKGTFTFFKDYILRKGFLYGSKGFLIAICNGNGAFYKYYKLMERNKSLKISLIITTYNRPDALELVLRSALQQRHLPFEIIIADDGSKEDTRRLIQSYQEKTSIPIKHIWHPDNGFKLAEIRNKAIAATSGDFISMIDGDIVMHPDFLKILSTMVKKNTYYQGKRVFLNEQTTHKILANPQTPSIHWWSSGIKNRLNTISISWLSPLLAKRRKTIKAVKGCSMHFWKEDTIRINGFNQDFIGWGREDSEFVSRALNAGIKRKNIILGCVGYHLYHPMASVKTLPQNDQLLADAIEKKISWCENGLSQYL